jgi:PAS domain S-box-containing protein
MTPGGPGEGGPRRRTIVGDYRRLVLLVLIMTGVAIIVGATALGVFYDAALERERQRLANFAASQALLTQALEPARLPKLLEEQRRLREQAAGRSAELQMARREGDKIVFLTPARGSDRPADPIAFASSLAEPMTQALSGRSGTMIGRDYAGRNVLAAYQPLPALGLGLVAKIDMAEINGRYLRAGLIAGFVSLIAVIGAAFLFFRVGEPMVRRLRESEGRLRAVLDASQDDILLLATDGTVLAINEAAERRVARRTGGTSPVGDPLDRLLPADQAEQRLAIVRQVAATATLAHCEVPIRDRQFEFWFYPVARPEGAVGEVAVYAREITEQKRSQAALSKLFQAVQQSPMSIVITDRDGTIEYVNPEFTRVTGYTEAEAIGQNPRLLKSGRTPPELYAEMWQTISGGGVWRGEFLNRKKNGELYRELASIAPVRDGDTITNFVAVKEDITERREVEEQLRQSQKMQAVGQLTGGIAHDFNNLLAIIVGNLQLLAERLGGDARAREHLDDALWSAKRGGELTRRLLAFARKQPLKPEVLDLNDVVTGVTELLRRTLGANVRIEATLAPDLWKAVADRGELERALVNLAVNARDAMTGGGTLALETRNAVLDEDYAEQYQEVTPGEYVLLAVTDTGTGMSADVLQRAFEPFFTTKEVGEGSGLGLSMVYGFIKQSGGHISIYSRRGQGTSVKLYLPRSPAPATRAEEDPPDVPAEGLVEKMVLVVEDEAKLRKVAVRMLDRLGLRSLQAETAQDALDLLANAEVDVLFTDIELPGGMSGTELADAAQERDPNLKVLFTTGYAREGVLHDRWLEEDVPWLLKPYSHQELGRELKALLVPTVH